MNVFFWGGGHEQKLTINFTYSLHCRRAEQHERCVSAVGCTNGDDLYQIYSIYKDLANGYLRLCENDTLSGCTVLSFSKYVRDVCGEGRLNQRAHRARARGPGILWLVGENF